MLNKYPDWPDLKQVCKIIRRTIWKEKTTTEVAYAITSVSRDRASAKMLLEWNRGHWGVENRLHWVRDETLGEDRCRVRTRAVPHVLAAIRNLVINWLRSQGIDTIAVALCENCWNPHRLFAKLGKPIL